MGREADDLATARPGPEGRRHAASPVSGARRDSSHSRRKIHGAALGVLIAGTGTDYQLGLLTIIAGH